MIRINHGRVDAKYAKTYGEKFTPNLKDKKELPTKFGIFANAMTAITKLVTEIDTQLIKNGMVEKREFKQKSTTA